MPQPSSGSRKHPRDDDVQNEDTSNKRKSSDGTTIKRSTAEDIANATARIAEMMKKQKPATTTTTTTTPTSSTKQSIEDRIAAAQARLAAKGIVFEKNVQALAKAEEDSKQARGGLSVNVHPSLLADLPTSVDRRHRGQVAPKFSTTLANLNRQSEAVARQM